MDKLILKVQKPLVTAGGTEQFLFNNEDKTIMFQRFPTPFEVHTMGNDIKFYGHYTQTSTMAFVLMTKAEPKDW